MSFYLFFIMTRIKQKEWRTMLDIAKSLVLAGFILKREGEKGFTYYTILMISMGDMTDDDILCFLLFEQYA